MSEATATNPTPESILTDPAPAASPGGDAAAAGAVQPGAKELVPDPAKTAKENAAAKAEHAKAKPADDAAEDKVPQDGKYEFKMPEGVELDAALAEALSPQLKELGIGQAGAQKLVDKYIEAQTKQAEATAANWTKIQEEWVSSARADKEIGGDKFDASVAGARRILDDPRFGSPELKEYLNASGGGNHPELIRLLARVGNAISNDKPEGSGASAPLKQDSLTVLYPNDTKGN